MNILITGGFGGIGSTLANHLSRKGHKITIVDNESGGSYKNLVDPPLCLFCDIRKTTQITNFLKDESIDTIVHLAALTSLPSCEENPTECYSNNTIGTVSILEAARLSGINKVVFASSSAVYENNSESLLTENLKVSPYLAYPLSKKLSEDICLTYEKKYGMIIPILRFFNVFGPRQNITRKSPPLINYIVREIKNNRVPALHSTGKQKRDYVHVNDVCNVISRSLTQDFGENIFNVCSGKSISVNEIYNIIKDALHSDINAEFRPSNKLWSSYNITIDPRLVEKETDKSSLGCNKKVEDVFGIKINSDLESLIRDTVKEIEKLHF